MYSKFTHGLNTYPTNKYTNNRARCPRLDTTGVLVRGGKIKGKIEVLESLTWTAVCESNLANVL